MTIGDMVKVLHAKVLRGEERLERPVYTAVRDEVPTYYGPASSVSDCTVADGCRIDGKAERSVLSRGVIIEEGASVAGSVIMDQCVIRSGAHVENAILDKNVEVCGSCAVRGLREAPAIIEKGKTVKE